MKLSFYDIIAYLQADDGAFYDIFHMLMKQSIIKLLNF